MTKILWFSRHQMTAEQKAALESKLGAIELTQVDGSPENVHVPFKAKVNGVEQDMPALKEVIKDFNVLAVVLPIGLQQQLLTVSNGTPVIMAKNNRVLIPQADGSEAKVSFQFAKWEQLKRIEIVLEDF